MDALAPIPFPRGDGIATPALGTGEAPVLPGVFCQTAVIANGLRACPPPF
jgi:hypothetical protein